MSEYGPQTRAEMIRAEDNYDLHEAMMALDNKDRRRPNQAENGGDTVNAPPRGRANAGAESRKYHSSGRVRRQPHDQWLSRTRGPITAWVSADDYATGEFKHYATTYTLAGLPVEPCKSGGFWVQLAPPKN